MTAIQVYEAVLIELNKVKAPSLSLEDFIYFFNKASQQYVNMVYNSYEVNQQTVDDLRVIRGTVKLPLSIDEDLSGTGIFDNVYSTYLPDDYLHILNCIVAFKMNRQKNCHAKDSLVFKGAKRLSSNANSAILNNYYLKPSYKNPYFYINNVDVRGGEELGGIETLKNINSQAIVWEVNLENKSLSLQNLTAEFVFCDETALRYPLSNIPNIAGQSKDIQSLYRDLLKIKNQLIIPDDSSTADPSLIRGLKVDYVDSDCLEVALLKCVLFRITGEHSDTIKIENGGMVDFMQDKKAGIRFGNKTKARIEIRFGSDKTIATPQFIMVDYLKVPQQISLTQAELNDIEDNSQRLEFPDYVIYEIINRLVMLLLENTGNPRVQIQAGVNQTVPTSAPYGGSK